MAIIQPAHLFLIVLGCIHISFQTRASYGETCDKSKRCDSKLSLVCKNGTCACLKENEMTFDWAKFKCVVLPGERCSYTAAEVKSDTTSGSEEKRWTETLNCVNNAACSKDGYCECNNDFYGDDSKGSCVPKKFHGDECVGPKECRSDKNLICSKGKCSCVETEAVWDSKDNQCVAKVGGGDCKNIGKCVMNSQCRYLRYFYFFAPPKEDVICKCDDGFTANPNGLCVGSHGSSCSPTLSPCKDQFTCVGGKCQCHFPSFQVWDKDQGRCTSNLYGPCEEVVLGKLYWYPCLDKNSECRKDNGISQCLCKKGCVQSNKWNSATYFCARTYGSECSETGDCDDQIGGLVCYNGTCSCPSLQEYDDTLMKCKGLVGERCRDNDFCIGGAYCEMIHATKGTTSKDFMGICQCHSNSQVDSNRKCISMEENIIK